MFSQPTHPPTHPPTLTHLLTTARYLTSVGIFFDGDKQNIKLPWDKIVKESVTASQIELEKQNGEPLIFSGDIDPKAAAVLKILPELDFIKN